MSKPTIKIKKAVSDKIQELNGSGCLAAPLRIGAIARPLAELSVEDAIWVLDGLSDSDQGRVSDPTSWVRKIVQDLLARANSCTEKTPVENDCDANADDYPEELEESPARGVVAEGSGGIVWDGDLSYKTVLCSRFAEGWCSLEEECTFAHGKDELKASLELNPSYKTTLCKDFSSGECPRDDCCGFAHGAEDLRCKSHHPNYKTIMCRNFPSGTCTLGGACSFAHSHEELRSKDVEPHGAASDARPPNFKTTLCKNFALGVCNHGAACSFAHGQHELRLLGTPIASTTNVQHVRPANYKSILCAHFQAGCCIRGAMCNFAHGQAELRSLGASVTRTGIGEVPPNAVGGVRPHNYKTTLCTHFLAGNCPRGANCNFAHGQEDTHSLGMKCGNAGAVPQSATSGVRPSNYKTTLCAHYQAGNCPRGATCNFAHGQDDLHTFCDASEKQIAGPQKVQPRAVRVVASTSTMGTAKLKIKKKLADYIRELNAGGLLWEPLRLAAVAGPLSALAIEDALEILRGLERGEADKNDPNTWVISAAAAKVEELVEHAGVEEEDDEDPDTSHRDAKRRRIIA